MNRPMLFDWSQDQAHAYLALLVKDGVQTLPGRCTQLSLLGLELLLRLDLVLRNSSA